MDKNIINTVLNVITYNIQNIINSDKLIDFGDKKYPKNKLIINIISNPNTTHNSILIY